MKQYEVKNVFGKDKDTGEIIHISECTKHGKACNCVCPTCGSALCAKLGNIRVPHFAHVDNDECDAAKTNESVLHLMTKEIICNQGYINLPKYRVYAKTEEVETEPGRYCEHRNYLLFNESVITYDKKQVLVEVFMDNFKPDLIIKSGNNQLCIEIAVTHFIDEDKKKKIVDANASTVEIDLSSIWKSLGTTFSRELLKETILDVDNVKWIHNAKRHIGIEKIKKLNEQAEIDYYKKQKQIQEKNEFAEKMRMRRSEIKDNYNNLIHKDINIYKDSLVNDKLAEEKFKRWFSNNGFYKESIELFGGIPQFCDVDVWYSFAFRVDRRIWQMLIFNEFIYKNKRTVYMVEDIYHNIFQKCKKLINPNFSITEYEQNDKYLSGDFVVSAIYEYIEKLKEMGFVKDCYEENYYSLNNNPQRYRFKICNKRLKLNNRT